MTPFFIFLLLILGLPTLELYLLIQVGSGIGALPTVGLVLFTAGLGAWLVRHQGLSTLMRVQAAIQRGEVPALDMLQGALLLLAGLLLLIPGFLTDAVGFLLLVPPLRLWLVARYLKLRGLRPARRDLEGEYWRESPQRLDRWRE